jgi:hypothetical protein
MIGFLCGFVVGALCTIGGLALWVARAYRWLASGK